MSEEKVRLDKWLWAARFFRTRSLAQQAIEGGKVHYDGARVKISKEVRVGAVLRIRQGFDEKTVTVQALSSQRGGAPQAAHLYRESEASIAERERLSSQRKMQGGADAGAAGRPSKRDRRQIQRFREQAADS
jgi:ribosome-associated heat shock protein Hsp15